MMAIDSNNELHWMAFMVYVMAFVVVLTLLSACTTHKTVGTWVAAEDIAPKKQGK